jgi:hypothetical protein
LLNPRWNKREQVVLAPPRLGVVKHGAAVVTGVADNEQSRQRE